MADEATCPHCGVRLDPGTQFCGECGKPVAAAAAPVSKRTMLGGPILVRQPNPAPAATPPSDDAGRTTAAGIAEPPRGQMGRTMLGIPQSGAVPPEAAPGASAARAAGGNPLAQTMLGLPTAPSAPAPAQPVTAPARATTPEPEDADLVSEPATRATPAGARFDTNRTMMGLADDSEAVDDGRPTYPPLAQSQQRTAYGEPERKSPARGSRPSNGSRNGARSSAPASRRGASKPVLALAGIALAAAAVLGYLALRPPAAPEVRVRVVSQADGESMVFEVPGVAAGSKLRFGGQEKLLEAGRASFALAPDSLRVGKNSVVYDLIGSDGDISSGRIGLAVDYRVTLDTGPLRAGKAAVDVVVAALPGSQVLLDGQPLALDAQGRAVRSDPLAVAGASDRIEHVVRYRVQPPAGEASVGELRTTIPVTMMEIDKPGQQVTTDHDSVEIAGAVDKEAGVSVDGQAVPVAAGRFLYRYALPQPGIYQPQVVASSPGKAPHAIKLDITRVQDLADAAKDFAFDASLNYAKIAQNPAIYRGQRVAVEGRVYNVNVEGGRSALQILVRDCPAGQHCPLWVGYHAATEYTVGSWVRVLGVIEGEQQFRSETDEIKVVPKLEATFLLPSKP